MMKQSIKYLITTSIATMLMFASSSVLAYYSTSRPAEVINANLGYVKPSDLPKSHDSINKIRLAALKEAATSLGAKGALAWRSNLINDTLNKDQAHLDSIFSFNQLILQHNVLPPVLVESDNNMNVSDNTSIRLDSKTYRIIEQARFVTTPPTWRNYLLMNFTPPDVPDKSLLPKTQEEAQAWDDFLKNGWEQGITQANDIFRSNLDRLKRDFLGMVLYKKLLSQHMVSAPYVAQSNLGVTGNKDEIHINDQVLRITSESELQTNSSDWNPVFTH